MSTGDRNALNVLGEHGKATIPAATAKLTFCEQLAAGRGLPATVQGFTPDETDYWQEPGLPWQPTDPTERAAVRDRRGMVKIWQLTEFATDTLAPRFPVGTVVAVDAVFSRDELEVGKVYARRGAPDADGLTELQAGRLVAIGGNFLELALDNYPVGLIWPLRATEAEATWDILEVTHYCYRPA